MLQEIFLLTLGLWAVTNGARIESSPWVNLRPAQQRLAPSTAKNHWAVLVAGSNGWDNYRHQADISHAYQILKKNGFPPEQIITMMYDDIAQNSENPTPGIIINHPNGSDVYHGVVIDYRGEDVTPQNFLKVLLGSSELEKAGKKVLKSGPNDRVFVNFADHGAPGLIAFPNDVLQASQLINAINLMHQGKKYKEMVFYIEACESGSMFENLLPNNINVYATTAANSDESSFGCYCDAPPYDTCLGDLYSVNWMEDSDKRNLNQWTLKKQFETVRQLTNLSHVMQFGNLTISLEVVANYQGVSGNRRGQRTPVSLPQFDDAVKSEDVPVVTLLNRYKNARSSAQRRKSMEQLQTLYKRRDLVTATFDKIVRGAGLNEHVHQQINTIKQPLYYFDCYEPLVNLVHQKCFNLGQESYALRHLYKLNNLCMSGVDIQQLKDAVSAACP